MNVRDLKVEVKQGNIYLLKLIFIALFITIRVQMAAIYHSRSAFTRLRRPRLRFTGSPSRRSRNCATTKQMNDNDRTIDE